MEFDSKKSVKEIFAEIQRYVEKRIELKTLEFQEKGTALAAAIVSNSMGLIMVVIGFFFLLVAAGIGLGYLFDNMMFGFGSIALFLIIVGYYIYKTSRNVLQNKIQLQLTLFVESVLETATNDEESATFSSFRIPDEDADEGEDEPTEPKEKLNQNETN